MNEIVVDRDIKRARCLPKEFYTDRDALEASKISIFARSWQFAGLTSEVDNLLPITLLESFLDEPILCVNRETVVCLSNVCTHRGNILLKEKCRQSVLRCGYHGRKFDLAGKFMSMPGFEGAEDFPDDSDNLRSVPSKDLGGMIFASIDPHLPFDTVFQEVSHRLANMPAIASTDTREYFIDAHWALYCENYLEGLHIPFVHGSLNKEIDFTTYETELFRFSSVQTARPSGNDGETAFENGIAAYYYFVFPNLMFNFYPWGLSFNSVEPISKSRTRIRYVTLVTDETSRGTGAGSDLVTVEMEDQEIVENVQKGISSRLYRPGRYSPHYEKGTHHFHRLIAEFMNQSL